MPVMLIRFGRDAMGHTVMLYDYLKSKQFFVINDNLIALVLYNICYIQVQVIQRDNCNAHILVSIKIFCLCLM